MVLSKVALTGGSFIRLNLPLPHRFGTKKTLAREWATVSRLRLERVMARASAQSISLMSFPMDRPCRSETRKQGAGRQK